jgi:outer membrane protein TolC
VTARSWPRLRTRAALRAALALGSVSLLSACIVAPEPLTQAELSAAAESGVSAFAADQEPVRGSIDLGEAMARAVLYNLDHRVQQAETVLRSKELENANIGMLPALTARAGLDARNNVDASSSYSVTTKAQSLQTSTSQDRDIQTAQGLLSWNVLDLGLSYVRAKQAGDAALVSAEVRRRVLAKLVEDVRTAYWRALAAEYLAKDLSRLAVRARTALDQSRQLIENRNVAPLSALSYQKEIYEIEDRLQQVEEAVLTSKAQLASLMNLPPGSTFSLVRPAAPVGRVKLPGVRDMFRTALENRPEMREALYQARSAGLESTIVLLDTLPSINAFVGPSGTSNSYTLNHQWLKWGAEASWNAMRVFTLPARMDKAEAQVELAREKAKAVASSIALQVAVSHQRYAHALDRLQTAADFRDVQEEIMRQLAASATAARSGDQELVREEMSALLARARYDVAQAEVQSAFAVILTTMGRDPYPQVEDADLKQLTVAFRARLKTDGKLRPAAPAVAAAPAPAPSPVAVAEPPAAPAAGRAESTASLSDRVPGGGGS